MISGKAYWEVLAIKAPHKTLIQDFVGEIENTVFKIDPLSSNTAFFSPTTIWNCLTG